jgi:hypothetical protein
MQKDKDDDATKKKAEQAKPHPYDVNYGLLKCSLDHVDVKSDEFSVIIYFKKQISSKFFICLDY